MKKIILLLTLIVLGTSVMAQLGTVPYRIDPKNTNNVFQLTKYKKPPLAPEKRSLGDFHSYWINFPFILSTLTSSTYSIFSNLMEPDTFLKIRAVKIVPNPVPHYDFTYFYNPFCSVGQTLNPVSSYLSLPNLNAGQKYVIDSVEILYNYERYVNDAIADTLVVQFFGPDTLNYFTWSSNSKPAFAVPNYNRAAAQGQGADYTMKLLLTSKDTFSTRNGKMAIKYIHPGFIVYNGGSSAVIWTFKPGKKYSKNDTIPWAKWDSVKGVTHPVNGFWWASYSDQTKKELDEYINGDIINAQQRYKDVAPAFKNMYLAGCLFTNYLYPVVGLKISYYETLPRDTFPLVTTDTMKYKSDISAICGGYVYDNGGHKITARGICWDTIPHPDIVADTFSVDGTGSGHFTSNLTNLKPHKIYFVRAYATNSVGTSYGLQVTFQTLDSAIVPILTTTNITSIQSESAVSGGEITNDGGRPVLYRGVCWSMNPKPTDKLLSKTYDGTGIGAYISNLTMLNPITKYYVRAYAKNAIGTGYGNELTFTTLLTGIDLTNLNKPFAVYSFGKKIYYKSNMTGDATGTLHIINPMGKEILLKNFSNESGQIDLSSYSNGIYIVRITCNQKVFVYKVNIQ